jgi:hypothetical protein
MNKAYTTQRGGLGLHEIPPTLNALVNHLTGESESYKIFQRGSFKDPDSGKEVHEMSNGQLYTVNDDRKWIMVQWTAPSGL